MQSTVLIQGVSGNLGKKETELNARIAEKEKQGWEVVDMKITRPSFVQGPPVLVLRLVRESDTTS
jgi:hypothetical protein